ncbi:MAG: glucodextranase DOMON-like domain-containing protein [Halanaerobiales bacterium]
MKLYSKVSAYLLVFLFIFSFTNLAIADDSVLLEIEDPAYDDYGPGTYRYPTNEAFQDKGLFDIRYLSIRNSGDDEYQFKMVFSNLTDPWRSKLGFSLPLIEIYIGKQGSGITELYREGANINLHPDYPWSTLLKVSGWWVRAYKPEDRNEEENIWDAENHPADLGVQDINLDVKANTITFDINKEIIGDLENAHLYVLVGSYDPFGPGNFRTINDEVDSWHFFDLNQDNLEYAPRVLDIILPEGADQAAILADFSEDYPTVVPIRIKVKSPKAIFIPYVFIFLLLFALVFFVWNKNPFISNNK